MMEDKDLNRLTWDKGRAITKRTTVIVTIKAIHAKAQLLNHQPELIPEYLVDVSDLDTLWSQFRVEDDFVLDYLTELDKLDEYPELLSKIRGLISYCKTVANKVIPKEAEAIDLSYLTTHPKLRTGDI